MMSETPGRFQFHLRKMLIWTAVWAIYLGLLRWGEVRPNQIVVLTVHFAIFLAIRARWGMDPGLKIAMIVGSGLTCCIVFAFMLQGPFHPSMADFMISGGGAATFGGIGGIVSFLIAHTILTCVDRLDSLWKSP
jgi:hypothetical protein